MSAPGTPSRPLRVAIVGAGPAAFYAADHLLKQDELTVEVDMFDKLPTPFGLVRGGVAPDHLKIKSITRLYHKIATRPGFRFFGNVTFGEHVHLEDLRRHYHQIFFATGAQTDRSLGIPGEDLDGSHSATEFVGWYNGHPDFRDLTFDLSQERVAVVGAGNVAVDVSRILCRSPEELEGTDIADYALEALRESNVREVYLLGRRGPAQAKFTTPEVKELGELGAAVAVARRDEIELDPVSRAHLEANPDRQTTRKLEIMQSFTENDPASAERRVHVRFLVSPVEIVGDEHRHVAGMRLVKNELYETEDGRIRPRHTDCFEDIDVGLVFRSVGYQGVPLPGVAFDEERHVVLNERGRVLDADARASVPGEYVGGWIKRGPTGVIGTNKADAVETVECMLEDRADGVLNTPSDPSPEAADRTIRARQPNVFTYEDWCRLDELELARGEAVGRPRLKFTCVDDMLEALGRPVEAGG